MSEETEDLEAMEEPVEAYEFDRAFQEKILRLCMRDSSFARKAADLIEPEYFTEDAFSAAARMLKDFVAAHKAAPDVTVISSVLKDEIAKKRIREDQKGDVVDLVRRSYGRSADLSNTSYVLEKTAEFAQRQAVQNALIKSVDLLERGDLDKVLPLFVKAASVGRQTGSGEYDYWAEIEARTKRREDFNAGLITKNGIPSGVSAIDVELYHGGWGRQELSVIMGAAKAGKTMSLGEFTRNASLLGHNTLYLSCEVSCAIIADRVDAALSDTAIRKLKDDPKAVERKIRAAQVKAGAFKMHDFASGTLKPSQIHRIVEDYRADGLMIDLLTVDYADIMAPEYRSDRDIENFRSIYIDLRAIAHEFNLACLTATQTNREGAKKVTSSMTDVADDFNKIRTADVVLGINATEEEKRDNECRITFVASRNTPDGFSLRVRQDREKMKFVASVLGKA